MAKHIGKDLHNRAKFHILGIDEANGTVELYSRDGWSKAACENLVLPWVTFMQGLMDGRYEVRPGGQSI